MLVERRPFPPTNNPWRFEASEDDEDILQDFKMGRTLFTLAFWGLLLGWSISKPIPLFPNWLGGLIVAGFLAYCGTFQNSRGDMLRFFGHATYRGFAELIDIMDEVDLKQKIGVVISKMLFFLRGIDKQYQIARKLRQIISEMIFRSTSMMYG